MMQEWTGSSCWDENHGAEYENVLKTKHYSIKITFTAEFCSLKSEKRSFSCSESIVQRYLVQAVLAMLCFCKVGENIVLAFNIREIP